MKRAELLRRLEDSRQRAEQSHLDAVTFAHELSRLEKDGLDATAAYTQMKAAENEEQKHLRQMDWVLDQLDQL